MKIKLLPTPKVFYQQLVQSIKKAKNHISLIYYSYEAGYWTSIINPLLVKKAQAGCQVNLMVDSLGAIFEKSSNISKNRQNFSKLRQQGINLLLFKSKPTSPLPKLHAKLAAIDNHTAYLGGSNIADHYLDWHDTNFKLTGDFNQRFHQLWQTIANQSTSLPFFTKKLKKRSLAYKINHSATIYLDFPPQHKCSEKLLLKLINNSKKSFKAITWYFLPTRKIQQALIKKAKQGTKIEFIISQTNRMPISNIINLPIIHKLQSANIHIYPWEDGYNHSKLFWNDQHQSILGSLNLERLNINHGLDLIMLLTNKKITQQLNQRFSTYLKLINQRQPNNFNDK